jgi:methyl-accepting chemotaxis protein
MLKSLTIFHKSLFISFIIIMGFLWVGLGTYLSLQEISHKYQSSFNISQQKSLLDGVIIGGLLFNSSSGVVFISSSNKAKQTMSNAIKKTTKI